MPILSSSPPSATCSTPSRSSYHSARSHQPLSSSPLASPRISSPTHDVQQRRRTQYKSKTSSSHGSSVTPVSAKLLFPSTNQASEDPPMSLLRGRLQARCREHAQKLRQKTINARRSSDMYSDVFMDYDDEYETDDAIMQDELFRRIIQNANHKENHSYRVSYALEVGSSFDPDMEDARTWESELQAPRSRSTDRIPDDMEEEELLEYAMFADFADIDPADVLGALSDIDDVAPVAPHQTFQLHDCQSSDMDVS